MSTTSAPPYPELGYEELAAWLRLALTPRIGNASARRLLAHLGQPQDVFAASSSDWLACVNQQQAAQLAQLPPDYAQRLALTWQWLNTAAAPGQARALITLGDKRYPSALLHSADPPLMLYAQGAANWLHRPHPLVEMGHCLAMVGSRHPTAQGADNARQFARALAAMGWSVISGLAAGIDAAAHQGALEAATTQQQPAMPPAMPPAHPCTVAVVGTGLDQVYPQRHRALAAQISQHGLLLSEFALGTPPIASNFPKRNRLIAGLSAGTLVVEAAVASGSLITARLASEQGREVFAIPGSIHAPQSRGCHALIRQGAKLVETAQDIIEELAHSHPSAPSTPIKRRRPSAAQQAGLDLGAAAAVAATATPAPAPAPAHPILDALGFDPMGLDTLSARTGLDAASLQAQLLELELEGWVASQPGGLFQRVAQA